MKNLGIVSVVALVSLSCQKKDGEAPGGKPAASVHEGEAGVSPVVASVDPGSESMATKSSERPAKKEKTIWVAEPVDGKPGYVKSPFSGKIIDVKGIPAGRMVADPMYPASEKKYFRVPEMPEAEDQELVEDSQEEELKKQNAPIARVLPGKAGFIFNPHDNKILDVGGIAPGTLLLDPTSPPGETRYIRIPGGPTE